MKILSREIARVDGIHITVLVVILVLIALFVVLPRVRGGAT
jgi:hypothetical protein